MKTNSSEYCNFASVQSTETKFPMLQDFRKWSSLAADPKLPGEYKRTQHPTSHNCRRSNVKRAVGAMGHRQLVGGLYLSSEFVRLRTLSAESPSVVDPHHGLLINQSDGDDHHGTPKVEVVGSVLPEAASVLVFKQVELALEPEPTVTAFAIPITISDTSITTSVAISEAPITTSVISKKPIATSTTTSEKPITTPVIPVVPLLATQQAKVMGDDMVNVSRERGDKPRSVRRSQMLPRIQLPTLDTSNSEHSRYPLVLSPKTAGNSIKQQHGSIKQQHCSIKYQHNASNKQTALRTSNGQQQQQHVTPRTNGQQQLVTLRTSGQQRQQPVTPRTSGQQQRQQQEPITPRTNELVITPRSARNLLNDPYRLYMEELRGMDLSRLNEIHQLMPSDLQASVEQVTMQKRMLRNNYNTFNLYGQKNMTPFRHQQLHRIADYQRRQQQQ